MNHQALYDRILQKVDGQAYLAYADAVDPAQREAMAALGAQIQDPAVGADQVRASARAAYHDGRIDQFNLLSVLHVIASSPKVRDYAEAARLIAEKELLAIREGGTAQNSRLASVERHRGAVAYLMGDHAVALEYFSRAFERQRSAGNLANVLNALIRLGDRDEAVDLLRQVRATLPERLNADLAEMISVDPDLALLRREL
jgi:tetratricopeptide (TPR) repeat protein